MADVHLSDVVLCTLPKHRTFLKLTKFKNSSRILRFAQILPYFSDLRSLLIHVPECYINDFMASLCEGDLGRLKSIPDLRINILLQNIDAIEGQNLDQLKKIGSLTCTTAHDRYCTVEMRKRFGIPLHRLSTQISPEQYERIGFEAKKDMLVISPDPHPFKAEILAWIGKRLPDLRMVVVQDMTYEDYKLLMKSAKWCLTFGEGLDNYFLECVFMGGVSFAIYNEKFFSSDFAKLKTVYPDLKGFTEGIVNDLVALNDPLKYQECAAKQHALCSTHYSHDNYVKNLKHYYQGQFTFS